MPALVNGIDASTIVVGAASGSAVQIFKVPREGRSGIMITNTDGGTSVKVGISTDTTKPLELVAVGSATAYIPWGPGVVNVYVWGGSFTAAEYAG